MTEKTERRTIFTFDISRFISDEDIASFLIQYQPDNYHLLSFSLMVSSFDELMDKIIKEYPGFQITNLPNKKMLYGHHEHCHLIVETAVRRSKYYYAYLLVDDLDLSIVKYMDEYSNTVEDQEFGISYYFVGSHGLDDYNITKKTTDFNYIINGLYTGIDLEKLADSYLDSKETVMILMGTPGVGKTTFIKYLMKRMVERYFKDENAALARSRYPRSKYANNSISNKFVDYFAAYAKGNEVISKEEFWAQLTSNQYKMLILDDLDFALLPRDQKDNNFMSNFLSFSDGVFDIDTKIIITTNLDFNEIDQALLRPGRCFDVLNLKPLDNVTAKKIWIENLKMSVELFESEFGSTPEINQSSLMSEYEKYSRDDSLSYLLDKSVSVRHSLRGKRKPGFGK